MSESQLPLIPQVAALLVWLETIITTVSSLMLTFVAVLTVASALNGGRLLDSTPWLSQAYAWCQGIGIEGQLSGLTFQAVRAARNGRGGQSLGFWFLTIILAIASVIAIGAVNYQESFGVTFAEALATVGISQFLWVWLRAVVLVTLLVLAAAMRYQPKAAVDPATAIQELRDKAAIAQAQAEYNAARIGGWLGAARSAVAQVMPPATSEASPVIVEQLPAPSDAPETVQEPPQGQDTPAKLGYDSKASHWTTKEFLAWYRDEFGAELPEPTAINFLKQQCEGARLEGVSGKPLGAKRTTIQRKARALWGNVAQSAERKTGEFAGMAAALAASE